MLFTRDTLGAAGEEGEKNKIAVQEAGVQEAGRGRSHGRRGLPDDKRSRERSMWKRDQANQDLPPALRLSSNPRDCVNIADLHFTPP